MVEPKAPDALRNVHGVYAAKAQGTIVYDKFSMQRNRSDERLEPIPGLPIYMGFDGGGRPACGIGQFDSHGQFRALREICSDPDHVTGAERFGDMVLNVLLRDFAGYAVRGAWGDPCRLFRR
ncbi:MAG: hypothetical protein U5K75_00015 [Ahrensia sp.]|nr:hypothetical protein [Ahrensia sp.]